MLHTRHSFVSISRAHLVVGTGFKFCLSSFQLLKPEPSPCRTASRRDVMEPCPYVSLSEGRAIEGSGFVKPFLPDTPITSRTEFLSHITTDYFSFIIHYIIKFMYTFNFFVTYLLLSRSSRRRAQNCSFSLLLSLRSSQKK